MDIAPQKMAQTSYPSLSTNKYVVTRGIPGHPSWTPSVPLCPSTPFYAPSILLCASLYHSVPSVHHPYSQHPPWLSISLPCPSTLLPCPSTLLHVLSASLLCSPLCPSCLSTPLNAHLCPSMPLCTSLCILHLVE